MSSIPPIITPPPPPPPPMPKTQAEWEVAHAKAWRDACKATAETIPQFVRVKKWWRSKTMLLGSFATIIGIVLEVLTAEREMATAALGTAAPWIIIGLGLAIKFLRWKTSTGVVK